MQIEQIHPSLYKFTLSLNDFTVNVGALIGEDGILLVDTGWAVTAEELKAQIEKLSADPVQVIIFTHQHGDHIAGRGVLGEEAVFLAHKGIQNDLEGRFYHLPPLPGNQQPAVYVDGLTTVHFNGEQIRIIPAPGHTASDLIVHFVGAGVCFLGDLLFSDSFPALFTAYGGDVETLISTLGTLGEELPADTRLIAGHGRDYTLEELKAYREMIIETSGLVRNGLDAGKDAAAMLEEGLLAAWEEWSNPAVSTEAWIGSVCDSLAGGGKTSIARPLSKTILEEGVDAAIAQYRDLKQNQEVSYTFGENELNLLGYNLLWREMKKESLAILTLQAEIFPDSANSYDSLGDVYEALGEFELARQQYQKSLSIDPEFTASREGLERLEGKGQQD